SADLLSGTTLLKYCRGSLEQGATQAARDTDDVLSLAMHWPTCPSFQAAPHRPGRGVAHDLR
ncbi:Hypothetical predicted protein, partial [Marmota monax]